jgi:hypothetical protein
MSRPWWVAGAPTTGPRRAGAGVGHAPAPVPSLRGVVDTGVW